MRRLLTTILCALMVISLMPMMAYGTEQYTVNATMDKETVTVGDIIHITASCEGLDVPQISAGFSNDTVEQYAQKCLTLSKTAQGIYEGDLFIDEFFTNGTYRLDGYSSSVILNKGNSLRFSVSGSSDDTTKPVLVNLEYNNKIVEAGDTLIITAEVEDENDLQELRIYIQTLNGVGRRYLDFSKVSDGIYQAKLLITSHMTKGIYSITNFSLTDMCGNGMDYLDSQQNYPLKGEQYQFEIRESEVNQTYKIFFSIDKTTVVPGDTIHLTATTEADDAIQINQVYFKNNGVTQKIEMNKTGEGVFKGDLTVTNNFLNGIFKGDWVSFVISGGAEFDEDLLENHNLSEINFTVSGASDDNTAPVLKSLSFDKNTISPGEKITITAEIEEENPVTAQITFYNPRVPNHGYGISLEKVSENIYNGEFQIFESIKNGSYAIEAIYLYDDIGNSVSYYFMNNNFEYGGEEYRITVTGVTDDYDPPVLKSLSVDTTEISEAGLIYFEAEIEDESELAYINIYCENGITCIMPSFSKKDDNLYEGYLYLDATYPTGKYEFKISISDKYLNTLYYENYDECFFVNNIIHEPIPFDGGDGTEENPYIISNVKQLNEVRYNKDAYFKLANDIVISSEDYMMGGEVYNSGLGWIPIGTGDSSKLGPGITGTINEFSGTFDGNGYSISGLKTSEIFASGLFGNTDAEAVIKNLSVINSDIKGYCSGAIVGSANDTILINCSSSNNNIYSKIISGGLIGFATSVKMVNCENYSTVNSSILYSEEAGGLIGISEGTIMIEECFNYGNVYGNYSGGIIGLKYCEAETYPSYIKKSGNEGNIYGKKSTGGIAGEIESFVYEACITECYNRGTVNGTGSYAGGLVGLNYDFNLMNCYNGGDIVAQSNTIVGGLVGHSGAATWNHDEYGVISSCYNTGDITGADQKGGIVGNLRFGEVENSYYLNNVSSGIGNIGTDSETISKSDAQMKSKENYSNFDFINLWKFIEEYDYPVFIWQSGTDKVENDDNGNNNSSNIIISGLGGFIPLETTQKPVIESYEGTSVTLDSKGTSATITVEEGYQITDVRVNGISKGAVLLITGLKTGDKVEIITELIPTQTESELVQAQLDNAQLVARSKLTTTKSGKKAIMITCYDKATEKTDFDGFEIIRSTKKNSGFKKIFTSKTGKYYNTAIKTGVKYYYKVRGFVEVDGEKLYTDWSLKAIRTAK